MSYSTVKDSSTTRTIKDSNGITVAQCYSQTTNIGEVEYLSNISTKTYKTWGAAIRDTYKLLREREVEKSARKVKHELDSLAIPEEYKELHRVLKAAFAQAAFGKGAERHGNKGKQNFLDQPMQSISNLLDSPSGMEFQIIKKLVESGKMETRAQRTRERLGVIVYTAGLILWDETKESLKGE